MLNLRTHENFYPYVPYFFTCVGKIHYIISPHNSAKMGTGSSPGGKVQPGRAADHSPLLVPRSWKSRAIPLPTVWATPGL